MVKPFHESIVLAIERVRTKGEMFHLGSLIKESVIPANHDAISTSWRLGGKKLWGVEFDAYDVIVHISQQKAVAEAKAKNAPPSWEAKAAALLDLIKQHWPDGEVSETGFDFRAFAERVCQAQTSAELAGFQAVITNDC